MTAKEKAKELFDKFRPLAYHDEREISSYQLMQEMYNAKQCALITANQILSILFQHHEIDYWKEVKQEITKL